MIVYKYYVCIEKMFPIQKQKKTNRILNIHIQIQINTKFNTYTIRMYLVVSNQKGFVQRIELYSNTIFTLGSRRCLLLPQLPLLIQNSNFKKHYNYVIYMHIYIDVNECGCIHVQMFYKKNKI